MTVIMRSLKPEKADSNNIRITNFGFTESKKHDLKTIIFIGYVRFKLEVFTQKAKG